MRRRKKVDLGPNFWPGYVDAMVNVVMNLLFMVALFGLTLVVYSSMTKKTDDVLNEVDNGVGDAEQSLNFVKPNLEPNEKANGTSSFEDTLPLQSIQESSGRKKIPFAKSGVKSLPLNEGVDFEYEPQVAGSEETMKIFDARKRRYELGVRLTTKILDGGRTFVTVEIPGGIDTELSVTQNSFSNELRRVVPVALGGRYTVWAYAQLSDPNSKRRLFAGLFAIRNQLVSLGCSPDGISLHLLDGSDFSGITRIHIAAQLDGQVVDAKVGD